jgi:hypothetical protein
MGGKWQHGEAREGDFGFYTIKVDSVQGGLHQKILTMRGGALGRHGELSLGTGLVAPGLVETGSHLVFVYADSGVHGAR